MREWRSDILHGMKKHQPDLSQVSQIDWARLAAYIDGEGCISIKSVRGYDDLSRRVMYVDITVANTDPRLPQWAQSVFGGSVALKKRAASSRCSDCFHWNVASRWATSIVQGCLPYFIIKREQAEVALAFQQTIMPNHHFGGCKPRPIELIVLQQKFKDELSALKGTSSRRGTRTDRVQ